MELYSSDDLLENVNSIIEYLVEHEDDFYVALEVAHQLRDEIIQALPDEEDLD
jgi:predicted DNA-binding protein